VQRATRLEIARQCDDTPVGVGRQVVQPLDHAGALGEIGVARAHAGVVVTQFGALDVPGGEGGDLCRWLLAVLGDERGGLLEVAALALAPARLSRADHLVAIAPAFGVHITP